MIEKPNPIYGATRRNDGALVPLPAPTRGGDEGPSGWTPMFAGEQDGTRALLKVTDWSGGKGVKPSIGYIGTAGIVAARAEAFNFNPSKRIESYTVTTRATAGTETGTALAVGEKKIVFSAAFPAPPRIVATARAALSGRPVTAEPVTVTTTYAIVRASQAKGTLASLLASLFDLVGGVTIDVLVIEA